MKRGGTRGRQNGEGEGEGERQRGSERGRQAMGKGRAELARGGGGGKGRRKYSEGGGRTEWGAPPAAAGPPLPRALAHRLCLCPCAPCRGARGTAPTP